MNGRLLIDEVVTGEESSRPTTMVVDEMLVLRISLRGTKCCLSHLIRCLVRRIHVCQGSNASTILCVWINLLWPFLSSTVVVVVIPTPPSHKGQVSGSTPMWSYVSLVYM